MANYRPMPETSMIRFIPYPATLYILAENKDTTVSQLMDLGKKWRADSVDVSDSTNEDYSYTWRLKRALRPRLVEGLADNRQRDCDAVVVCYWWD